MCVFAVEMGTSQHSIYTFVHKNNNNCRLRTFVNCISLIQTVRSTMDNGFYANSAWPVFNTLAQCKTLRNKVIKVASIIQLVAQYHSHSQMKPHPNNNETYFFCVVFALKMHTIAICQKDKWNKQSKMTNTQCSRIITIKICAENNNIKEWIAWVQKLNDV